MNQERMLKMRKRFEGYEKKLYKDSVGKQTIGIGYNIDDLGLPDHIILQLYEEMTMVAINDVHKLYPDWQKLSEDRQMVLVDMSYNMGYPVFKKFKLFWKAVKAGDTEEVVKQMRNSKWYGQVGFRADALIKLWRKNS